MSIRKNQEKCKIGRIQDNHSIQEMLDLALKIRKSENSKLRLSCKSFCNLVYYLK